MKKIHTNAPLVPQDLDHLLLDVALNPNERGRESWHLLRPNLVFDDIDNDQQRLMPLVHRSLTTLGIEDEDLGRMRGLHRNYWYRNQMLVSRVEPTISALTNAGIDVMVMKGLPLGLSYYPDLGMRPMVDADLFIRFSQFRSAVEILRDRGFVSSHPGKSDLPMLYSAWAAKHPDGTEIDLHWQVHQSLALPDAPAHWERGFWTSSISDDEFWARVEPITVGSALCCAPSPEDLLLHVCAHNAYSFFGGNLRWVTDAAMILRSQRVFDWAEFIEAVRCRRVVIRVRESLEYLTKGLDIFIPEEIRAELRNIRPTYRDRAISHSLSKDERPGWHKRNLLKFLLITHRQTILRAISLFPVFIAAVYGTGRVRRLPIDLLNRYISGRKRIHRTSKSPRLEF